MWKWFIVFRIILWKWFIVKKNSVKNMYYLFLVLGWEFSASIFLLYTGYCSFGYTTAMATSNGFPWLLIFEKYPIDIDKRKLGLIFIIMMYLWKRYWVEYPFLFCRPYCIALVIVLLFWSIVSCIVEFSLQLGNIINCQPCIILLTVIHMQSR